MCAVTKGAKAFDISSKNLVIDHSSITWLMIFFILITSLLNNILVSR